MAVFKYADLALAHLKPETLDHMFRLSCVRSCVSALFWFVEACVHVLLISFDFIGLLMSFIDFLFLMFIYF